MFLAASSVAPIPYERLALCLIPVGVVCLLLFRASEEGRAALTALVRMLVQLSVVGYALVFLFELDSPLLICAVLTMMLSVAGWITLRPLGSRRAQHYPKVLIAMFLGAGSTLALVSQGVLDFKPWYAPRFMIPLAGMIFANSMNSLSVAADRFHREFEDGAPYKRARAEAFRAGMIPAINSLMAVGLVSLPGMMTGQILSGVSPEVAARYQIMVMCMLFGASGLSIAGYLWLLRGSSPHP